MSTPERLDPRVEEILREVASDPRSSLLRVPRPAVAPELLMRDPRVGLGRAGLTAAERELLRVHRAEVARLLKEICKERLANEERSRYFLSRYLDAEHEVEILEPAEQRRKLDELRGLDLPLARDPLDELDPFELLELATSHPREGRPSIAQLALASLRLEPEDSTRVCLGLDLAFSGASLAGLGVLANVAGGVPRPGIHSIALENAALVLHRLGQTPKALSAGRAAAELDPARPQAAFNWLLWGLWCESTREIERALSALESAPAPVEGWKDEVLRHWRGRVRMAQGALPSREAVTRFDLPIALGERIRSLLHELP